MQTGKRSRLQAGLIIGAAALTAALYFAPKKVLDQNPPAILGTSNFETQEAEAKKNLKRQEADVISGIEKQLELEPGNISLLDSLALRWDALQQPAMAAHYFEEHAQLKPDEKSWLNAAYRYFDASRIAADTAARGEHIRNAIRCYGKVLELNPHNLDAKTDLGLCYAEGTTEPMRGIMLLREVVAEDSAHENAQFNLGVLSMRSGQYEKAVDRFEKVLAVNPERKEMYLMIGRAYMMAGDHPKAISNFNRVKNESADATLVAEANNYINQISNH